MTFFSCREMEGECLVTMNSTNYPLISIVHTNVMLKRSYTLKLEQIITASENGRGSFYPTHLINLCNALKTIFKIFLVPQNPFH